MCIYNLRTLGIKTRLGILGLKKYNTPPYSKNHWKMKPIFYLVQTHQIQNIPRELCYHARFFTATDSTKE
ncbi:hypothetical protein AhaeAN59_04360 [Acinetobacter haemolyticus]|uniref:Uncharacterized protein n=1 Tax=Acinetobacter haemolyticus TaxID=29430 RepID=A0A857IHX4_ACIHA|nr:hypothetical protein AhaeAN59_04360 [Acinetobacter haemolyticus]QHI12657.1 hypothetical protein AhaeAN43_04315 [Acinetobacter haemolyticus]